MFQNIGFTEIAIILVIIVLFVGGSRLPIFGKGLGQVKGEFKKGFSDETETSTPDKKK